MTAAGWYNAEGDPPGTTRYWDGAEWVGEPVYEPSPIAAPQPTLAPPMPPPAPNGGHNTLGAPPTPGARRSFPSSLRALAITVSVLKTIPMVIGLVFVVILAGVSNELNNELGDYDDIFDAAVGAATVILLVMFLIGGTLLGFQFMGAIKRRPMMVFIPALIMSIIDVLITLGTWTAWNESRNDFIGGDDSAAPAVFMTAIAATQIWIAVQAIRANRSAN